MNYKYNKTQYLSIEAENNGICQKYINTQNNSK